jgi:putative sigma-54 modulation protein
MAYIKYSTKQSNMKITILTPGFKAQSKLTDYIESHVSKLATLDAEIMQARVILKIDKSDTGENKICELTVIIPGHNLFAKKQCATFEEAVTACTHALKHSVERLTDSKDQGKLRGSEAPRAEEARL